MATDITQLIADMRDAASQILNKDVSTIAGFSERQMKAIAEQAVLVETGIATGEITEGTRDFFLNGLEEMVLNFVKTLCGLLVVTIEQVWNAIVGVIWKAIETATGIVLPRRDIDQVT